MGSIPVGVTKSIENRVLSFYNFLNTLFSTLSNFMYYSLFIHISKISLNLWSCFVKYKYPIKASRPVEYIYS